jgi:hypothetical protein
MGFFTSQTSLKTIMEAHGFRRHIGIWESQVFIDLIPTRVEYTSSIYVCIPLSLILNRVLKIGAPQTHV